MQSSAFAQRAKAELKNKNEIEHFKNNTEDKIEKVKGNVFDQVEMETDGDFVAENVDLDFPNDAFADDDAGILSDDNE